MAASVSLDIQIKPINRPSHRVGFRHKDDQQRPAANHTVSEPLQLWPNPKLMWEGSCLLVVEGFLVQTLALRSLLAMAWRLLLEDGDLEQERVAGCFSVYFPFQNTPSAGQKACANPPRWEGVDARSLLDMSVSVFQKFGLEFSGKHVGFVHTKV